MNANLRIANKKMGDGGFTLLEMIISIGLFSVLVIAAIGVILGVSRAQSKAANLQAVLDNVRFSTELITRELRTGTNYQIVNGKCSDQIGAGLQFVSHNRGAAQDRLYYHADTDGDGSAETIMRIAPGDTNGINCDQAQPLTSEQVIVDLFRIELAGAEVGPGDGQPRASLSIRVSARDPKLGADTMMNLHTAITQRLRDTE